MEEGANFDDTLILAQENGYAEPDPSFDIEGMDAAHKIGILSSLAFGTSLPPNEFFIEGIKSIESDDFMYAAEYGYTIKHLAVAAMTDNYHVELRAHPALISSSEYLSNLKGVRNGIEIETDLIGKMHIAGSGAGQGSTASGIISDLVFIANKDKNVLKQQNKINKTKLIPFKDIEFRNYFHIKTNNANDIEKSVYKIFESFNVIAPRIQGGASREDLGEDSELYIFLLQQGVPLGQAAQIVTNIPTYWGNQPILEAPAYIGITIFFFAILGIILVRGPTRNTFLIGALLSLFLSWGKNLPLLTYFMIDYFPFYNKFRAVSSIQVILEFCLPVLAALGMNALFRFPKEKWKKLLKIFLYPMAILVLLLFIKGSFSFEGLNDYYYREIFGASIFEMIIDARKDFYSADVLRALIYYLILSVLVVLSLIHISEPTRPY